MKIYNVYHTEEWVGSFLQASFSTKENAELYIKKNPHGYPESEMSIMEYELDSDLQSAGVRKVQNTTNTTREEVIKLVKEACSGLRTMQLDDCFGVRTIAYVFATDEIELLITKAKAIGAAEERELLSKQEPVAYSWWSENQDGHKRIFYDADKPIGRDDASPLYGAPLPTLDGWQLVPKNPPDCMVTAFLGKFMSMRMCNYPDSVSGTAAYIEMLAAAPQLPKEPT